MFMKIWLISGLYLFVWVTFRLVDPINWQLCFILSGINWWCSPSLSSAPCVPTLFLGTHKPKRQVLKHRTGTPADSHRWVHQYPRLLTMRLHIAPCLLCMSGVSRTCSVVTMASPISSHWEEPNDPTPEHKSHHHEKSWRCTTELVEPDSKRELFCNQTKHLLEKEKVGQSTQANAFNGVQCTELNILLNKGTRHGPVWLALSVTAATLQLKNERKEWMKQKKHSCSMVTIWFFFWKRLSPSAVNHC